MARLDKPRAGFHKAGMSFVERFATDGWLKIGGIFETKLIDAMREEFQRQFDAGAARQGDRRDYLQVGDERLMLSVKLHGPFLDPRFYANPLLLEILEPILHANFLIDSVTCVIAMPGAGEQRLHADHGDLFPELTGLGGELSPHAVTVVIPLVDLVPETGTTRLFPGTHRGIPAGKAELPYVKRGDCFLMDYRIEHQGTANRSATVRPVVYLVYARPWFIDVSNFRRQPRINIDAGDVAAIPKEQRPLFRRLAAKGMIDKSEKELFAGA